MRNIYAHIYGLFNDAPSSSDSIASNGRATVTTEEDRAWKNAAVAETETMCPLLPGAGAGNHKMTRDNSRQL
jgi:hypothetical protein